MCRFLTDHGFFMCFLNKLDKKRINFYLRDSAKYTEVHRKEILAENELDLCLKRHLCIIIVIGQ